MCWKHWSIYRQCLPNSHFIKTTTQPLLELINLFEPDWNTDVKYVHTKLQNKFQENKNNTPVGIHSQKQFAMQRAASDTQYYRFERTDKKKKPVYKNVCFITGTYRKFINTSDHWHGIGGNCTEKWKEWPIPNRKKKKRKPRDLSPIDFKHSLKHN